MAGFYADRVCETSASTGTGNFSLSGAITGYQRFSAGAPGTQVTCYYLIEEVDSNGLPTGLWETGIGTYGPGGVPNTLSRNVVINGSSGAATLVTFASGVSRVHLSFASQSAAWGGAVAIASTDLTGQNFTTAIAIPWNADQFQTDPAFGFHDTVTNNSRMKIPSAYGESTVRLRAQISLSLETANDLITLTIRQSGSTVKAKSQHIISGTAGCFQIFSPALQAVPVGAYFEVLVLTSTDVSSTLVAAESFFEMEVLQ